MSDPIRPDENQNESMSSPEAPEIKETEAPETPETTETTDAPQAESPAENIDDGSTIFSDSPTRFEDKPKKSRGKMLKTALSLLLALAVLAGATVAVVKLIPRDEDGDLSSDETVYVTDIASEDVNYIKITGKSGSNVYRTNVTVNTTSSGESSSEEKTISWSIDGIDPALTDSSSISFTVDGALKLPALRSIERVDGADYGFASPTYKIEINAANQADSKTLLIGSLSPTESGYYATADDGETVYLVESSEVETFGTTPEEMSIKNVIAAAVSESATESYFDSGSLAKFDSITFARKGQRTLTFGNNTSATGELADYIPYVITAPARRFANENSVAELLEVAKTGLTADRAYVYEPTAADKAKYGLNNPDIELTIRYGGKTVHFIGALQQDEGYAVMADGNERLIFRVTAAVLPFADNKVEDFLTTTAFMEMLSDMKRITIKTDKYTHVFDIAYDEDADESFQIKADGKDIKALNFQTYYQYIVGTQVSETTFDKQNGKTVLSFTAESADGKRTVELRYAEYSDRRYYVETDGVPIGFVTASYMQKLIDYADDAANDKEVPSP